MTIKRDILNIFLFIILMIAIMSCLFIGFNYENKIYEKGRTEACNEIGFNNYISMNNEDYCSNDSINLFRVNINENGLYKYTATKVNLYNYGENGK